MAQSATPPTDAPTTNTPGVLPDDATVVETPAGGLVYEVETEYSPVLDRETEVERRLIGFTGVESWQGIRDELRKRGTGTGATRHLPEFDRR